MLLSLPKGRGPSPQRAEAVSSKSVCRLPKERYVSPQGAGVSPKSVTCLLKGRASPQRAFRRDSRLENTQTLPKRAPCSIHTD